MSHEWRFFAGFLVVTLLVAWVLWFVCLSGSDDPPRPRDQIVEGDTLVWQRSEDGHGWTGTLHACAPDTLSEAQIDSMLTADHAWKDARAESAWAAP